MYVLPDLSYGYGALEPYLDKETMLLHHTKHHQAYTDKLNAALEKQPELFEKSLDDLLKNPDSLPEEIRTAVRNNGGGYLNHKLFFESLAPAEERQSESSGKLAEAIKKDLGSFSDMIIQLKEKTAAQFGSGWGWLVLNPGGHLEIISTNNQDSPLSSGLVPLLGLDVWEHAYYLKYQNRRAEYLEALLNVINWRKIDQRFEENT